MQKMLEPVSKIDEVESIDEILLSEPWQKFAKDLLQSVITKKLCQSVLLIVESGQVVKINKK